MSTGLGFDKEQLKKILNTKPLIENDYEDKKPFNNKLKIIELKQKMKSVQ
jgi:hypothetical protein